MGIQNLGAFDTHANRSSERAAQECVIKRKNIKVRSTEERPPDW
jgi:hypothetical protein